MREELDGGRAIGTSQTSKQHSENWIDRDCLYAYIAHWQRDIMAMGRASTDESPRELQRID